MDASADTSEVIFHGANGSEIKAKLDTANSKLHATSKTQLGSNIIYCRITRKNKLLRVSQGTNNLEIVDLDTGRVEATYPGKEEEPYTYEMYRSFRYAKEDQYPLWRRGGSSLVLLDPKKFEIIKDFKKFWPPGYIAMRCCVSKDMTRIYGFSFNENDGIFSIVDIDKENETVRDKTIKIPKEQKWIGMEFSTAEDTLVIANSFKVQDQQTGKTKGFLKMMAADLSSMKIKLVAQRDFTHKRFRTSQLFRKIKGYDYFVVASGSDLSIIAFTGNDFVLLSTLEKLYNDRIIDIAIFGNYMVPVAKSSGENVRLIEFKAGEQVSMIRERKMSSDPIGSRKSSLSKSVYAGQRVRRIKMPFIRKPKLTHF